MNQDPVTVRRRFHDVDELDELARRWDVDFRQLEAGRFQGYIAQWLTPTVQLSRAWLSHRVDQRGSPPRGLRTIAIHRCINLGFVYNDPFRISDIIIETRI